MSIPILWSVLVVGRRAMWFNHVQKMQRIVSQPITPSAWRSTCTRAASSCPAQKKKKTQVILRTCTTQSHRIAHCRHKHKGAGEGSSRVAGEVTGHCLTRELAEQNATRVAKAILDMEYTFMDENSMRLLKGKQKPRQWVKRPRKCLQKIRGILPLNLKKTHGMCLLHMTHGLQDKWDTNSQSSLLHTL